MKIKMFKKIIAVLCAATMSMSTISSVGAAGSTGTVKLDQNLINLINQDNQNDQNNIINNQDNQNGQNNIMGMMNNIMNMMLLQNKRFNNELIQSLFEDIKNNDLEKYANCTIYSDLKNILDNLKKMGVMENPEKNQRFIKQFLKNQLITRLGFADLSNDMNNNMNMMNNINQINQCLQMCMLTQQNYMSNKNFEKFNFNIKNIQKNNSSNFQALDSKIMNDNALKDNISKIRNNMLKKADPSKTALETKFSNKFNEFNRKKEEVKIFAQHKLIDPAPAEKIEQNCITDIFALDLNGNFMEPEIKILDDYISKIDKFISGNDFTVANSDMSRLKKTYQDKFNELQALIENAKMNNPFFSFTKEYKTAKNFINLIDFSNNELLASKLKEAIQKLDDAIKSIKPFSMGVVSKLPYLKWQDQAHDHIDELFNDAINKMQTSANQFSIDNIKKEFNLHLCGQQKFGNCWLYAICNLHNFLKHFEEKKDDIVRNKGQRDTDDFDEVERFFNKPQFGFSMDKLKNVGGSLQDESDVLNKLEINHSRVHIAIKKDSAQSRETAIKIVKTLLLKHFAASITPVLVDVMDDTVSCHVNNGLGGNHTLVVVGLDIDKKAVVVANSQCGDLQEYSLDRIASAICNNGITGCPLVHIGMIFPSFTHQNNFYYDNSIHSWDEFKSKLLPAISKPL